jgi:hypothetical protein
MRRYSTYQFACFAVLVPLFFLLPAKVSAQYAATDTIVSTAVIYMGDTIEAKTLVPVWHRSRESLAQANRRAEWTRLRNAIYVTFPYAKKAGFVMNDINARLVNVTNKAERKKYIKSREKELKKEFADPLMNLSVYQGKVLMKLIHRETGNNCYEIIKEYKGGVVARFYQTVAFFFGSNLKQPYDKQGDEAEMEKIVKEVERMYGYRS